MCSKARDGASVYRGTMAYPTINIGPSPVIGNRVALVLSYAGLGVFATCLYFQAFLYPGFVGLTIFGWLRLSLGKQFPSETRTVHRVAAALIAGIFLSPFILQFAATNFHLYAEWGSLETMERIWRGILGTFAACFLMIWIWRDLVIAGFVARPGSNLPKGEGDQRPSVTTSP